MLKIDSAKLLWEKNGLKAKIVDAPKDAQTFDKMLIVFADENCKIIRKVILYSNKENKCVMEY